MKSLSCLFLLAAAVCEAATLTDVGTLAGGSSSSALGVSSDGLVVVGESDSSSGKRAFRWTSAGGMQNLGTLLSGSYTSTAHATSADGTVVVGVTSYTSNGSRAFRWTAAGGMQDLGVFSGFNLSVARGVSANGSVVVGHSNTASGFRAFRWTAQSGMVNIGALPGSRTSFARGVSADGNIVVGNCVTDDGNRAFLWTAAGGMISLGVLTGGAGANATAISADGTVVVGNSGSLIGIQAMRWTANEGMTGLGMLPGYTSSEANAVSSDGSVIAGTSTSSVGTRAFRWDIRGGMIDLGVLPGGYSSSATGVSADGSVVVGTSGSSNGLRAFIYQGSVMLDAQDWIGSVSGVHSLLSTSLELSRTHLEGAHHRPLADLGRTRSFWVTGDLANSSSSRNLTTNSGEAGATFAPMQNLLLGIGAGYADQNQNLSNGGSANTAGQYMVGEVDLIQDNGGILSFLASFGDWRYAADRGYVTGFGVNYSHGETNLSSNSLRLRYDSPVLARIYAAEFKSYVSYAHSKVSSDAFTETGGSYPGSFSKMEQTAKEGRLGLAATRAFGENFRGRLSAEWIRRFDRDQASITATDITSTLDLTLPSAAVIRDQARFGFDLDYLMDAKTTLSFTVHVAGRGESPDVSGAVSLRRAF